MIEPPQRWSLKYDNDTCHGTWAMLARLPPTIRPSMCGAPLKYMFWQWEIRRIRALRRLSLSWATMCQKSLYDDHITLTFVARNWDFPKEPSILAMIFFHRKQLILSASLVDKTRFPWKRKYCWISLPDIWPIRATSAIAERMIRMVFNFVNCTA